MNDTPTPPGLASVRSGLAPFSAEQVALDQLRKIAQAAEEEGCGPTQLALDRLWAAWHMKSDGFQKSIISSVLTAALLEASRG